MKWERGQAASLPSPHIGWERSSLIGEAPCRARALTKVLLYRLRTVGVTAPLYWGFHSTQILLLQRRKGERKLPSLFFCPLTEIRRSQNEGKGAFTQTVSQRRENDDHKDKVQEAAKQVFGATFRSRRGNILCHHFCLRKLAFERSFSLIGNSFE